MLKQHNYLPTKSIESVPLIEFRLGNSHEINLL